MTDFDFGDVILVPFPFTDQSAAKQRPAVVVSSTRYHDERPDVILMAITSQLRSPQPPLDLAIAEWKTAGLLKASAIKPVITTAERTLVRRKLGRLGEADRRSLEQLLRLILGS